MAPSPRKTRTASLRAEWLRACEVSESLDDTTSGLLKYVDDPIGYCRDRLGFEPWARQREVLAQLAACDSVSAPAGRAVGKSALDGAAALWFAETRPGARVILTAPTFKQVQNILWEEITNLRRRAKIPIPIDLAKLASTGGRHANGSQILGLTAEQPENFQGIRGGQMLVIADEASGITDEIFHVIDGNTAGGAKLLLTGNPTKATGYFRESQRSPRFRTVRIPSTESPNVGAGRIIVRGLATREWIEERKREWGEDSPLYKIHVLGEVVEALEGRLFSAEMIAGSEARWDSTQPSGRLVIGVDPAGASGEGDESAFTARRGNKVLKIYARQGLTEDGHLVEILGMIGMHRGDSSERPLVVIDRDGYVGARVWGVVSSYQSQHEDAFQLLGIRSGERARRKPLVYDRVRDEMWFGLVDAIREGLAIPEDLKLERDLAAIKSEPHISGRSKVTSKDDLRKTLEGRSPDRADSLCLSVWNLGRDPGVEQEDAVTRLPAPEHRKPAQTFTPEPIYTGRPMLDPYATWGSR